MGIFEFVTGKIYNLIEAKALSLSFTLKEKQHGNETDENFQASHGQLLRFENYPGTHNVRTVGESANSIQKKHKNFPNLSELFYIYVVINITSMLRLTLHICCY